MSEEKIREFFRANPGMVVTRNDLVTWLGEQGIQMKIATLQEHLTTMLQDGSLRRVAHGRYAKDHEVRPLPASTAPDPGSAATDGVIAERITIGMTALTRDDLKEAAGLIQATKADIVGRAVRFLLVAIKAIADGGGVYIRPTADSELERVYLL